MCVCVAALREFRLAIGINLFLLNILSYMQIKNITANLIIIMVKRLDQFYSSSLFVSRRAVKLRLQHLYLQQAWLTREWRTKHDGTLCPAL